MHTAGVALNLIILALGAVAYWSIHMKLSELTQALVDTQQQVEKGRAEIDAALAALKASVQSIDDIVPDAPAEPPAQPV